MDVKVIAIIAGCVVTLTGALAYALRKVIELLATLIANHLKSLEAKFDEKSTDIVEAVKGCTTAISTLAASMQPPPSGGVLTATSEDETPPLGIVRPDGTYGAARRRKESP